MEFEANSHDTVAICADQVEDASHFSAGSDNDPASFIQAPCQSVTDSGRVRIGACSPAF